MLVHDGPEGVVRDALILSARDEDHLVREGTEPRDGAARTGGDGVVVPLHAAALANELDAVLHARKGLCDAPHILVRDEIARGGERRHIVLHVVIAGEQDLLAPHDRHNGALAGVVEDAVLTEHAV